MTTEKTICERMTEAAYVAASLDALGWDVKNCFVSFSHNTTTTIFCAAELAPRHHETLLQYTLRLDEGVWCYSLHGCEAELHDFDSAGSLLHPESAALVLAERGEVVAED